jgi:hypothetical protein
VAAIAALLALSAGLNSTAGKLIAGELDPALTA